VVEVIQLPSLTSPATGEAPKPGRPIPMPCRGPRFVEQTEWPNFLGQRVVCVMDDANIRLSAKTAGGRFSYRGLREYLARSAAQLEAWAVLSAASPDNSRLEYFRKRGWQTRLMLNEPSDRPGRPVLRNADFDLVALCTERACFGEFDVFLVGSGDGELVRAVARAVRRLHPPCKVVTLSIEGATSHTILERNAPGLIWSNVLVGLDLVHARERQAAA